MNIASIIYGKFGNHFFLMCLMVFTGLQMCTPPENQMPHKGQKFSLDNDLFEFSRVMQDGDTLRILSDLSLCESFILEEDVLIKSDDKIIIATQVWDKSFGEEYYSFEPTEYVLLDSLNFENLFQFAAANGSQTGNRPMFTIIYKNDTIRYFFADMTAVEDNIKFFLKIKDRIYPNENWYNPVLPYEVKR